MSRTTAYIINERGSKILSYEDDFMRSHYYPLRDYIDGNISPEIYHIEMDKYIKEKQDYITRRIYEEMGYEEARNYNKDIAKDLIPCLGGDGQCCMDCAMFGRGECEQQTNKSTHYI